MGQKVNPHGLRVGVIKDWDSRWYARNDKVGDLIVEDYNIRKDLKKRLYAAGIAKIEIERIPVGVDCPDCGYHGGITKGKYRCPACGSVNFRVTSGREYFVDSVEAE